MHVLNRVHGHSSDVLYIFLLFIFWCTKNLSEFQQVLLYIYQSIPETPCIHLWSVETKAGTNGDISYRAMIWELEGVGEWVLTPWPAHGEQPIVPSLIQLTTHSALDLPWQESFLYVGLTSLIKLMWEPSQTTQSTSGPLWCLWAVPWSWAL